MAARSVGGCGRSGPALHATYAAQCGLPHGASVRFPNLIEIFEILDLLLSLCQFVKSPFCQCRWFSEGLRNWIHVNEFQCSTSLMISSRYANSLSIYRSFGQSEAEVMAAQSSSREGLGTYCDCVAGSLGLFFDFVNPFTSCYNVWFVAGTPSPS
eukprot:SAG11_NODE_3091_length_2699_cov_3.432910_1_plen_155_part_00